MWEQVTETLNQTFLGNSLWQWLGFLLVIVATFIVRVVVRYFVDRWLKKLAARTATQADDRILKALRRPAFFLVYIVGFYLALGVLTLPTDPIDLPRFITALLTSLLIVDAAWFLYSATDILALYLKRFTAGTESKLDDQLVPIVRRACRVVIILLALVMIVQNLGYSVSSLLAGLGLGGLAFAFAAKDSLANIFGSVTIFTDRPFQVGDWIKVPGAEGTVEDVGFRSTRIRTFGKTLVTIPNSKLADNTIENMDARPVRRVKMTVGVTYETKAAQMKKALEAIREILRSHAGVDQGYWLVYFTDFGASSLDIFVYYFTKSKVWAEYLEVRQDVNLLIMEKLEELGLEIAFPTQTVYLKKKHKGVAMLLAIDIGNTNIVLGAFEGQKLIRHWRVGTQPARSADEYGIMFGQLLSMEELKLADVDAAILSCVVPPIEWIIIHMLEDYCQVTPLVVGPGIKTGMKIKYDNPKEVGADRIVNAVAALDKYPGPLIIVDFGTATTFDAISKDSEYLGGAIAPGINISMEALFRTASKLPRVPFARPEAIIGRNTVSSIQSGLFHGYVGLVDGIIDRMAEELGSDVRVLATGGLGKLIATTSRHVEEVDNLLTLRGLRVIYERNL